ncbi:hypothetical protein AGABI2DRAFT_194351 [Agaricus bisporus var. bisporus H97]|uniref:hypothetical protein n=1 Tax=Agaricus bisporus var. bisporus (strain H97 / ATCC MYA-4626 / FGSC 10389) TaxID=936046 RepID=UPI00029F585F|nr:hypothetical protein AGABI2DRAFT_194351 [Agaricus bisporus var. bisporus H97]EKV45419.1 hypothetical protein AGABI2DRAFT_194351 [Agaricus bisporus var. bisporus H97]
MKPHSDHPCGDDWVSAVGGFIGPRLVTSSLVLFSTCTRQICRTGTALGLRVTCVRFYAFFLREFRKVSLEVTSIYTSMTWALQEPLYVSWRSTTKVAFVAMTDSANIYI